MKHHFCSDDFKAQPYWWDLTPCPAAANDRLPGRAEVLVIGSGYTGLHCALQTAAAGRSTVVIDADTAGWGCSTRNGGQISGEIKPDYEALRVRVGSDRARALIDEARSALDWLVAFIEQHRLDCDLRRCGRFLAAHNPRQFRLLEARARNGSGVSAQNLRLVPRAEQASEIDSPYYHGGVVIDHHCGLDPAKYHRGLLGLARAEGVRIVGLCRAEKIERQHGKFRVATSRGVIEADHVVVATNGYTAEVTPWQRRRIIPIGSYMLATEPMEAGLADSLIPADRVCSDTRRVVVYFRRSPDGRRLLFGGRVSVFESDPVKSLPALRREMLRIFPQLGDVGISHAWMGFVGYTFDTLPHLGVANGIHYAMGYCGSGICLASYLGHRLGQQLVGDPAGRTAFDGIEFQTRPLYRGRPWFLAAAVRYYQLLDRLI